MEATNGLREYIRRHRLLWNWISGRTIELGRPVSKQEAFLHFHWPYDGVYAGCWACEANINMNGETFFGGVNCEECPLKWEHENCIPLVDLLNTARIKGDISGYASIAEKIANTPLKENYMAHLYQYIEGTIRRYRGSVEPFGRRTRFICEFGKKFICSPTPGVVNNNIVWYEKESYSEAIRAFIAKKAVDLKKAYRKAEHFEREIDNLCYIQSIENSTPSVSSLSGCFENHQKMWSWIAKESEMRGFCMGVRDAFYHFGWNPENVYSSCWACQAAISSCGRNSSGGPQCSHCLLDWPNGHCQPLILRLRKAKDMNDVKTYVKIAKQIANLPMREEYKDER